MASGSFDLTRTSGTQYLKVWLEWSSSSDIASNTSSVTVTMKAKRTNTGYTTYGTGTFKIGINGAETSSTKSYSITSNEVTLMTATQNVSHNSDGTKSIEISGEYTGDSPIGGNGSQTVTLDTIARASNFTLSATSIEMNKALTITINRASTNFIHQIFYHFGSKNWQGLTSSATDSYAWTVPLNLANEIPNATSGVCTIIVETYNGTVDSNHYIGTTSKTVTLTVPSSVMPTISSVALAEATSGLATQFGVYVQDHSRIKGTITASGTYSSTISTYKTEINGSTYSTSTFTTALLKTTGTNTVKVTVTDSRGRITTKSVTFNVTAYSNPRIETFTVERDETTTTTVAVKIKASITNVNSKNTYSYVIKYKKTSASTYTSKTLSGTTSVDTTVTLTGLDENSTYDFVLEVKDYFTTMTCRRTLSTAFTILDFNKSGKGMAIGKVSEKDAFEVGMVSYFEDEVYFKNGNGRQSLEGLYNLFLDVQSDNATLEGQYNSFYSEYTSKIENIEYQIQTIKDAIGLDNAKG